MATKAVAAMALVIMAMEAAAMVVVVVMATDRSVVIEARTAITVAKADI